MSRIVVTSVSLSRAEKRKYKVDKAVQAEMPDGESIGVMWHARDNLKWRALSLYIPIASLYPGAEWVPAPCDEQAAEFVAIIDPSLSPEEAEIEIQSQPFYLA